MGWKPITAAADLVGAHEGTTFDAKGETYDVTHEIDAEELAKDIAAFASALGGTIVLGAHEDKGRIVHFQTVADAAAYVTALSTFTQGRFRPLPVIDPIVLTLDAAQQRAVTGRDAKEASVDVIALNVQPHASPPVAVRVSINRDPKEISTTGKKRNATDAWRFPVRLGEVSRYMMPDELPMIMNSHERRVGLLLRRIPLTDQTPMDRVLVRIFDRRTAEGGWKGKYQIVGIDDELQYIEVKFWTGYDDAATKRVINVPFAYIKAVWPAKGDTLWNVHVDGTINPDNNPPFYPAGWV